MILGAKYESMDKHNHSELLTKPYHIIKKHIFKDNLLENLWYELSEQVGAKATLPMPPKLGDFDLSEVLDSEYIFS